MRLALVLLFLSASLSLVSCGDSTEDITPNTPAISSPSSQASPGGSGAAVDFDSLPAAESGYRWFVTAPNDFGLPRYALQVPSSWVIPPNDSNPVYFAPKEATTYSGPALLSRVTPKSADEGRAFRFGLPWQGGGTCGIMQEPDHSVGKYTWQFFNFTCPLERSAVCFVTDQKIECTMEGTATIPPTFSGRAAEVAVRDVQMSILYYNASPDDQDASAFFRALESFIAE